MEQGVRTAGGMFSASGRKHVLRTSSTCLRLDGEGMPLIASLGRAMVACALLVILPTMSLAEAATNMLLTAALDSITSDELYEHVAVLADDVYEGREAGTRGGHAAASYIAKELRNHGLKPAGSNGDFVQSFNRDWRNVLALQPGDDPELAHEIIVVGAHFDHVGYGRRGNSYGPAGRIHNGADDNASGVSLMLETIEAFATSVFARVDRSCFPFGTAKSTGSSVRDIGWPIPLCP